MCIFDLDLEPVIAALAEKSKEADVKLVIDDENVGNLKGNKVISDDSSQFTHNKFCVADNKYIFTGSFNPTINGDKYNNNNVVVLESELLAQNYEEEFMELWEYKFGAGKAVKTHAVYLNNIKVQNFFCPEDSSLIF